MNRAFTASSLTVHGYKRALFASGRFVLVALSACYVLLSGLSSHALGAERRKIEVVSTIDGSSQPSYLIVPEPDGREPNGRLPLLVALHTWSADLEQRNEALEAEAQRRGWLYLWPNFRGPNQRPEACGSPLAQQDILDAVAWVAERWPVDRHRIYLTGISGGGHMTLLMAARYPGIWAAASAWVGISDLARWHARHADDRYGAMLRACCGGPPGARAEVDEQYRLRSPITFLRRGTTVPLDIAHGIHDGHTGSVPIRHSIEAFNALALAAGCAPITDDEVAQLSRRDGRLRRPREGDEGFDEAWGRRYYLRRVAGPSRITIFEGGHEGIARAAIEWLAKHRRPKPARLTSSEPADAAVGPSRDRDQSNVAPQVE